MTDVPKRYADAHTYINEPGITREERSWRKWLMFGTLYGVSRETFGEVLDRD